MADNTFDFSITVDDGSIEVPIRNKKGEEIGVFYFNPTDLGMIDRFNSMADDFGKVLAPLESISINADGTADGDAEIEAVKEAECLLYEACNKLFNGNMASAFFGKVHPFSPIGGKFYCEIALEAVGNFIEKQFAAETKKMNARIDKYTGGYTKGKGKGTK